jgi:hypothetical protein
MSATKSHMARLQHNLFIKIAFLVPPIKSRCRAG